MYILFGFISVKVSDVIGFLPEKDEYGVANEDRATFSFIIFLIWFGFLPVILISCLPCFFYYVYDFVDKWLLNFRRK